MGISENLKYDNKQNHLLIGGFVYYFTYKLASFSVRQVLFYMFTFYLIISIRKEEKYEIHGICRKIDELIEEEVTININGVVFTGFSTVCPYKIEEGKIILLFSTLQF